MKIAVFSTKSYTRTFFKECPLAAGHDMTFFEAALKPETSRLAFGFHAVCVFVNDVLDAEVLETLADHDVRLILLRCAGFNNVDLAAAERLGLTVARVPEYSPYAVAEHTAALMLALNRKIYRAYNRVRDGNFSLEGLLGFDMHGRTVGVVGTGSIGRLVVRIMTGFGCRVVAYDVNPCAECGAEYVALDRLFRESDIVTLHVPLMPATHHLIDAEAIARMRPGVMLINTSRGGLIDTRAVIEGLKKGRIGYLGLDVYEEEGDLFFEDLSGVVIQDDVFARLLTFPNVVITGHQAFFTRTAMENIAHVTLQNAVDFERDGTVAEARRVVPPLRKG